MKKILTLTIAAFAMASAVFAQTEKEMAALETKANAAVDKVAAKVKKAEDAADLKAFKEKQKAELAAFIEAQKTGKKAADAADFKLEKPTLANFDEETAYFFGLAQSDKEGKALRAGQEIGDRIVNMTQQFSNDYYTPDEGKSVNPVLVASGIVMGLMGQNDVPVDSAAQVFQQRMTERQASSMVPIVRQVRSSWLRTRPSLVW